MREIKFRGKRVYTGKWVYGYYKYSKILNEHIIVGDDDWVSCTVIPETVGQYTGSKDRHGVEIYEGDIVTFLGIQWDGPDGDRVNYMGVVKYSDNYVSFNFEINNELLAVPFEVDDILVIGNIYDNPEMMGRSDERN